MSRGLQLVLSSRSLEKPHTETLSQETWSKGGVDINTESVINLYLHDNCDDSQRFTEQRGKKEVIIQNCVSAHTL